LIELKFEPDRSCETINNEIIAQTGKTPVLISISAEGNVKVAFDDKVTLTPDDIINIETILKRLNPNIKFKAKN